MLLNSSKRPPGCQGKDGGNESWERLTIKHKSPWKPWPLWDIAVPYLERLSHAMRVLVYGDIKGIHVHIRIGVEPHEGWVAGVKTRLAHNLHEVQSSHLVVQPPLVRVITCVQKYKAILQARVQDVGPMDQTRKPEVWPGGGAEFHTKKQPL